MKDGLRWLQAIRGQAVAFWPSRVSIHANVRTSSAVRFFPVIYGNAFRNVFCAPAGFAVCYWEGVLAPCCGAGWSGLLCRSGRRQAASRNPSAAFSLESL